jgi:hypothetical protein
LAANPEHAVVIAEYGYEVVNGAYYHQDDRGPDAAALTGPSASHPLFLHYPGLDFVHAAVPDMAADGRETESRRGRIIAS